MGTAAIHHRGLSSQSGLNLNGWAVDGATTCQGSCISFLTVVIFFCTLLGLAIGSFLNVVIWRVPRGESIVSPPSACPKCGQQLRNRDNIPVVSWLILRGKCRDCGNPISVRYPVVELLTAALFALMSVVVPLASLPAYLWLAGAGVALAAIDLDVKRLPNVITYPSIMIVGGWLIGSALIQGEPSVAIRTLLGGVSLGVFYLLIAFAYPQGMGLGDVKLAPTLGFALGYLSWSAVIVGGLAAFVIGAIVGVLVMVMKKSGRKTAIPFGPFMLIGALIGMLWGQQLANWYLGIW